MKRDIGVVAVCEKCSEQFVQLFFQLLLHLPEKSFNHQN